MPDVDPATVARVRELYPPSSKMRVTIENDRRIYMSAMAQHFSARAVSGRLSLELPSLPSEGFSRMGHKSLTAALVVAVVARRTHALCPIWDRRSWTCCSCRRANAFSTLVAVTAC
jgi:hypothetical protein